MRNLRTNNIQGLQVIHWDEPSRKYTKKMLQGMRAKSAVFRIGDKNAHQVFLCEGMATGLSIVAALRSIGLKAAVLVCFSANNIEVVAQQLTCRAFICADNDVSKTGQKTAENTGLAYCMSPVEGEDMNDLHLRAGLFSVCTLLMDVRRRSLST
jgi:putative DNA primase/helicase